MNILFVHQNFPGQFRALAPALVARGDRVVAMSMNAFAGAPGLELAKATASRSTHTDGHPWTQDFDTKVIRAEASFRAAMKLREEGFYPDVIIAHPGWGESLFLKFVWPKAKLGIYCEFFYRVFGTDMGFDPEFPMGPVEETECRMYLKNINNFLHFELADAGISPTKWQADSFPAPFRDKISVIHDGIDTVRVSPNPDVAVNLGRAGRLTRDDEIITFVNRNLEPYRGYHVFMRALPELMRRRPKARILIVGGDDVSYGAAPPKGETWRKIFQREVWDQIDQDRVHFLGSVPYTEFLALLALSTVHVYLTYPFVLSWSLLEAMATECAIVASDTQPLHEAIVDGKTGRLVDFFDREGLVDRICELLEDPKQRAKLGAAARKFAVKNYDLATVCLPKQLEWVEALAKA